MMSFPTPFPSSRHHCVPSRDFRHSQIHLHGLPGQTPTSPPFALITCNSGISLALYPLFQRKPNALCMMAVNPWGIRFSRNAWSPSSLSCWASWHLGFPVFTCSDLPALEVKLSGFSLLAVPESTSQGVREQQCYLKV